MIEVYEKRCKNCLLSSDRIVSSERVEDIIQSCMNSSTYFICHKASIENESICCKGFYDKYKDTCPVLVLANRLKILKFVSFKDNSKLISYKEMFK